MEPLLSGFKNLCIADAPSEMAWVKSLNLMYGTKLPEYNGHKVCLVDGDELHFRLRCMENEARQSRDYNGSVPNYVVASISFVVSDRLHVKGGAHGRRLVIVPIKFNNQEVTHVTSVYPFDAEVKDKRTYKRSPAFLADLLADSPTEKQERIELYYGKATNTFSDSYHHSERALWGSLRDPVMIQQIVAALSQKILHGAKVYCAVLDLHSTRYMCSECEPSSFGFQKRMGKFSVALQGAIASTYKLPQKAGFRLLSRVSAEDPGKRSLKGAQDHQDFWQGRDIRVIKTNLILQRDDRTTGASQVLTVAHGIFVSSQKLNPAQGVYVTQRRDNQTVALELTASCKQFVTHIEENKQRVKDMLVRIKNSRDQNERLRLLQEAYALIPDDINVWIEYFAYFRDHGMLVEKLDFIIKIYRVLRASTDERAKKNVFQALHTCFEEAFCILYSDEQDLAKATASKIRSTHALLLLDDSDCFQIYLLRSKYFTIQGSTKEAIADLEKALFLVKQVPDADQYKKFIELVLEELKK